MRIRANIVLKQIILKLTPVLNDMNEGQLLDLTEWKVSKEMAWIYVCKPQRNRRLS